MSNIPGLRLGKLIQKIVVLSCCWLIFSFCDRPECKTTNKVLATLPPASLEYKQELVKQLERNDSTQLSYWFSEYLEKDGQEFMKVTIKGEGFCAEGLVLVKQWDEKIVNIKRVRGKSYGGAQLAGLEFNVESRADNIDLIYRKLDRIID